MIKSIYYKRLVVVLIFNFLSFSIYSQITGRITDINNIPLANVNIYVENSYNGTTSNAEGNYTLQISSAKQQTIVFKYLGYQTEKRLITLSSEPSTLNITLQEERVSLDEVILNSDVNPANRIIKAAISNRKKILASIKEYKTDFYSRGFIKLNNVPKQSWVVKLVILMVVLTQLEVVLFIYLRPFPKLILERQMTLKNVL